ncbi:MAG TPA: IS1595 family transposase, partial [Candidatus Baltobacteraceae bacterium]
EKLSGAVEADETYVGGKVKGIHRNGIGHLKSRGPAFNKTIVMGMRERGGKVRAFVVPDTKRETLLPRIHENVAPGTTMYTDSLMSYRDLRRSYAHFIINHAQEYVCDQHIHTNNIENFWSVLKRTLGGTYVCPRPKHLNAYPDEQIFRFNERENKDGPRFAEALKGADGKRLTYKALIAKAA